MEKTVFLSGLKEGALNNFSSVIYSRSRGENARYSKRESHLRAAKPRVARAAEGAKERLLASDCPGGSRVFSRK